MILTYDVSIKRNIPHDIKYNALLSPSPQTLNRAQAQLSPDAGRYAADA